MPKLQGFRLYRDRRAELRHVLCSVREDDLNLAIVRALIAADPRLPSCWKVDHHWDPDLATGSLLCFNYMPQRVWHGISQWVFCGRLCVNHSSVSAALVRSAPKECAALLSIVREHTAWPIPDEQCGPLRPLTEQESRRLALIVLEAR